MGGGDIIAMDPHIDAMLNAKPARVAAGPYRPLAEAEIAAALHRLFANRGEEWRTATNISRLAGGASKEQFTFEAPEREGGPPVRMVLRLDPLDGVLETSRRREAEVLKVAADVVPVPTVHYADYDGSELGSPGLVTSFVSGKTKPSAANSGVSGLGTGFSAQWRETLAPQFIDHLVAIHGIDVRDPRLAHFGVPERPQDSALWEVNHWARVWREDRQAANPVVALTENWLRANLPHCDAPVLVHGDYRTGNYLFDEDTGQITALLDWELAHVGDFHQDLALGMIEIFGQRDENGVPLCSSLMPEDELIRRYETASGRKVERRTLTFYRILSAWSLLIMGGATGLRAAAAGHNHQDILLTWLSMVVHPLSDEIIRLIKQEIRA